MAWETADELERCGLATLTHNGMLTLTPLGRSKALAEDLARRKEMASVEAWLTSIGGQRVGECDEFCGRWRLPGRPGAIHDGAAPAYGFIEEWKAAGSPQMATADLKESVRTALHKLKELKHSAKLEMRQGPEIPQIFEPPPGLGMLTLAGAFMRGEFSKFVEELETCRRATEKAVVAVKADAATDGRPMDEQQEERLRRHVGGHLLLNMLTRCMFEQVAGEGDPAAGSGVVGAGLLSGKSKKPEWAPSGRHDAAACASCGTRAVFWNELNGVVQCHGCGEQAEAPTTAHGP